MLRPLTVIAACLLALLAQEAVAQKMYFTGNGNGPDPIYQADLSGAGLTQIVTGLASPQDVDVDMVAGKVYWTDSGAVQRANLNGTNVETVVAGAGLVRGVAVDPFGGKVYWTGLVDIKRANLNGTGQQTVVTGLNGAVDVVLDLLAGHMYWTDINNKLIQRANLDGSNVVTITTASSWGIALDPPNGQIYFTTNSTVGRVDYSGANMVTLATGFSWANGIAVDSAGGKMYWTDRLANQIYRADLNGTNQQTLISGGIDTILSIVLESQVCPPATSSNYGAGFPGTLGVPALTAITPPILGTTVNIQIGNSLGAPTTGLLFIGLTPAVIPGFWGGDLLLNPSLTVVLPLATSGLAAGGFVKYDTALCGLSVYLQVLQADAGALAGASSTPGLKLTFGL